MSKHSANRRRGWPIWAHICAVVVLLFVVQTFVVRQYQVPSESMAPTLQAGDRILVYRWQQQPVRGELIVFTKSAQWPGAREPTGVLGAAKWFAGQLGIGSGGQAAMVKRVIGVAGDTVSCCDLAGALLVNEEPINEPYLINNPTFDAGTADCASTPRSVRCFGPVKVPEGMAFVLGDNRGHSADSLQKCRGSGAEARSCVIFATTDRIVGKVGFRIWPLGGVGPLAGDAARG